MKINFHSKGFREYEKRNKLSTAEELFINQLENDNEFEKKVLQIRQKFGIPKNGYPESMMGDEYGETIADMFSGKTNILSKEKNREQLKEIGVMDDYSLFDYDTKLVYQAFNLHDYWIDSFECFITFNVLPLLPPTTLILYAKRGTMSHRKKLFYMFNKIMTNYILIIVQQKCSKKQIIDWIDNAWTKGLKEDIGELPIHPESNIGILNVYKRLVELKKQGMTANQIAEQLEKEHLGRYGYETIKPMFNRYQKYLVSLKTKKG